MRDLHSTLILSLSKDEAAGKMDPRIKSGGDETRISSVFEDRFSGEVFLFVDFAVGEAFP